jgi:Flp pilus assembly pilin Flp
MKRIMIVAMNVRVCVAKFLTTDGGLTITEYAIAAGLIAATIGGAFTLLGTTIDTFILAITAFL